MSAIENLSASDALDITPNDSTDLPAVIGLYVGSGGNVAVTTKRGSVRTFVNVPTGSFLPIAVKRVMATGTTATSLIGLVD